MFGTPLIMSPRQVRVLKSTASPSTVNGTSPKGARSKPVAVTTTSASTPRPSEPDAFSVNSAICR